MANNADALKSSPDKADNPYIRKEDDQLVVTEAGYAYLNNVLTDSSGRVYVFNNNIPPVLVAAAMARLSRRPGDMRLTLLDEFATSGEEDASALIQRVVTAYGDDSVQQLTGLHVVVEGASNIVTKLLEWGRFMAALEQSSRYIYFDQRDAQGHYLYLDLPHLPTTLKSNYDRTMNELFETYSRMVRHVTEFVRQKYPQGDNPRAAWLASTRAQACDAVRVVLPAATKSTVGMFGSAQAVESLIMHLLSEPLPEAQEVGQQILEQARQVIPAFLERTDRDDRGGAFTAYRATTRRTMCQLASEHLKKEPAHASGEVKLQDYWPRNESDLVAEMLFEGSDLSLVQIKAQVALWRDKQKTDVIKAYCGERLNRRHKPGRAIEKAHFEFEFDGKDYGTFRDLQRHRVVDAMEWQKLTPAYGYEVPELVAEAGIEEDFHQCFALSSQLYTAITEAGFSEEAQYATLFGHRMRYRFTMNLRQLFHFIELRTSPQGHPGYRKICQTMYELVAEVYPLLAQQMIFVNQGEDPALTRLAAERATQFKLTQLGLNPDGGAES